MKEILEFKEYLFKNHKSRKTVEAYMVDINQFLDDFIKDKLLSDITNEDIELYKNYMLLKRHLDVSTVNRKLVAINQFLTYCQIAVTVSQVKVHTQNFLENIFINEDISKLIQATEDNNDLRAKALMMTLKLTGMRISETLQMTIDDIYKDTVMVIGKGNKRRNVFIPKKLKDIWLDYCKVRVNKTNFLFTGNKGAINRYTAHKILKKYANISGVDFKKVHCHNFRHHYCKELADKKVSIDIIADVAGHVNINTTRIYVRKTKEELLEIINEL